MKKINAFLFICFYLFATKIVFASTVEVEGKSYECKKISWQKHSCLMGTKKAIVVQDEVNGGYVAIVRDAPGVFTLKGVKKLIVDKNIEYQTNDEFTPYQDSLFNRMLAADTIVSSVKFIDDAIAKEFFQEASKIVSNSRELKTKVKLTVNSLGKSYDCKMGETRPYTAAEIKMQAQYKAKFVCPYYSCVGSDPTEKVLMMLPKAGNTFLTPSVMYLKHGSGRYITDEFKVTDGGDLPYISLPKKVSTSSEELAYGALNPDLLVPSNISKDPVGYNYLLSLAKKTNVEALELIDLCSTDKTLASFFAEQQKVANTVQEMLAKAEIVEYLKMVDDKILSFYVDRAKGLSLGCLYQDKVIDSSVVEQFDRLKKLSTISSTGKFLKPEEAQELFKKAKNMKDIPFGYKYDGCYARAHLMARRFEEMGVPVQKVWIKGKLSVPNTDIRWDYHVAPSVQVKEKNGKIVNYVIDPSLTEKAVPLDDWISKMSNTAKGPVVKTTFPFPDNGLDFERTAVAISNSDIYGPRDFGGDLPEEDKINVSKQRLKMYSEVLEKAKK